MLGHHSMVVDIGQRRGRMHWFVASLCVISILTYGDNASAETTSMTVDQVIEGIESPRRTISSLRLVIRRRTVVESGQKLKEPRDEGYVDFAFSDSRRYLQSRHRRGTVKTVKSDDRPRPAPPAPEWVTETRVFDGDMLRASADSVASVNSTTTARQKKGSRFDVFYLRCVGWFLPDPVAAPDFENRRQDRFLPEALRRAQYTCRQDTIDGRECVRLDGHIVSEYTTSYVGDTVWLDPARGFMLIRRHFSNSAGRAFGRITTDDPVEVHSGLWLPRRCTMDEYPYEESDPKRDTLTNRTDLELEKWSANDVPDSVFGLEFSAGTLVADFAEAERQGRPLNEPVTGIATGDGELFDQSIGGVSRGRLWLLLVTIVLVMLGGGLVVTSRLRGRAQPDKRS